MTKQFLLYPLMVIGLAVMGFTYNQTNYNHGKNSAGEVLNLMEINNDLNIAIYEMNVSSTRGDDYDTGRIENLISQKIKLENNIEKMIDEGGVFGRVMLKDFYRKARLRDQSMEAAMHQKFQRFLDRQGEVV